MIWSLAGLSALLLEQQLLLKWSQNPYYRHVHEKGAVFSLPAFSGIDFFDRLVGKETGDAL